MGMVKFGEMLLQKQDPLHLFFAVDILVVGLAQLLGIFLGEEVPVEDFLQILLGEFAFSGKDCVQPTSIQFSQLGETADTVSLFCHDSFEYFTELRHLLHRPFLPN